MISKRNVSGFAVVTHPNYRSPNKDTRLIQESSAVGDYPDSMDNPGSSFLWVGNDHHLNREEVTELVSRLLWWLKTGHLVVDEEK